MSEKTDSKRRILKVYDQSNHEYYIRHFRTKICTHYLTYSCKHDSSSCFKSHDQFPERRILTPNDFEYFMYDFGIKYSATKCRNFMRNSCQKGVECKFAHSLKESDYHPTFFKTIRCKYYEEERDGSKKICRKNGIHCSYAHGEDDLYVKSKNRSRLEVINKSKRFRKKTIYCKKNR